jgi:ubiquinol-cytochrome c reductase iron-sulfur subunit
MAKAPHSADTAPNPTEIAQDRRDFMTTLTVCFGAAGAAGAAWPFISSMNPAADVKAQSTTEVSLTEITEGTTKTVMWRGKPVFIRHRTAQEVADMKAVAATELKDNQTDTDRVKKDQWLVVMAVCTHLGCVPAPGGDYGAWICPCHGSQFDASGRIRKGPAPTNLEVPPYAFIDDNTIKIG